MIAQLSANVSIPVEMIMDVFRCASPQHSRTEDDLVAWHALHAIINPNGFMPRQGYIKEGVMDSSESALLIQARTVALMAQHEATRYPGWSSNSMLIKCLNHISRRDGVALNVAL
jgi:hypothetical protein